ncbi:MAG: hypothetical protein ABI672_10660, partial [Vicinamibacteria bacterium]
AVTGLITALALAPMRSPGAAPARAMVAPGRSSVERFPGFADLRRGSLRRGYTALTLALFVVVAVGVHGYVNWNIALPETGFLNATFDHFAAIRYAPLPAVSLWPLYWTYESAPYFWAAVAVAAVILIVLYLQGRRRLAVVSEADTEGQTRAQAQSD